MVPLLRPNTAAIIHDHMHVAAILFICYCMQVQGATFICYFMSRVQHSLILLLHIQSATYQFCIYLGALFICYCIHISRVQHSFVIAYPECNIHLLLHIQSATFICYCISRVQHSFFISYPECNIHLLLHIQSATFICLLVCHMQCQIRGGTHCQPIFIIYMYLVHWIELEIFMCYCMG